MRRVLSFAILAAFGAAFAAPGLYADDAAKGPAAPASGVHAEGGAIAPDYAEREAMAAPELGDFTGGNALGVALIVALAVIVAVVLIVWIIVPWK